MKTTKLNCSLLSFYGQPFLVIGILFLLSSCAKTTIPNPSNGNNANGNTQSNSGTKAILLKEVSYSSSTVNSDSVTSLYTYDINDNLLNKETKTQGYVAINSASKTYVLNDETLNYSYSSNGLRSQYTSASHNIVKTYSINPSILVLTVKIHQTQSAQNHFSGSNLISSGIKIQTQDTNQVPNLLPTVSSNLSYDSVTYTYNTSGYLNTVSFYLAGKLQSTNTYTLSFTGNNLTKSVLNVTSPAGNYTTTTDYEYDNKVANNGLNIINDINYNTDNNLTKVTSNTVGALTESMVTSYNYQYDSQNRLTTSLETITETLNGKVVPTITVNNTFYYKN